MSKRAGDGRQGSVRCPVCRSGDTVPIRYGMPGDELRGQFERGEVELGGCVVGDDDPDRACRDCETRFVVGTGRSE